MGGDRRSPTHVRRELADERERLADAVDDLRRGLGTAGRRVPILVAGALGAGLVVAGGVRAGARLLFRRGRE